jgi:hypothetical protein
VPSVLTLRPILSKPFRKLRSVFGRYYYHIDAPIIAYQMGKVGSMTVVDGLGALSLAFLSIMPTS